MAEAQLKGFEWILVGVVKSCLSKLFTKGITGRNHVGSQERTDSDFIPQPSLSLPLLLFCFSVNVG